MISGVQGEDQGEEVHVQLMFNLVFPTKAICLLVQAPADWLTDV